MKIFEYIDRINLLHKLIKERRTGTPENLAKRLLISPSRLYVILEELKLRGAPINYSREFRSYYYVASFEMSINADFKLLNSQELKDNNGGNTINNIHTTFFVEWANVFWYRELVLFAI